MSRARWLGGLGGNTRCVHLSGSRSVTPRTEPGVTELPGLTSDPVLTADRRGGILISFGLHRTALEGINPSKRWSVETEPRSRKSGVETELNGPQCRLLFRSPSECPVRLKGVGFPCRRSIPTGLRISFRVWMDG